MKKANLTAEDFVFLQNMRFYRIPTKLQAEYDELKRERSE